MDCQRAGGACISGILTEIGYLRRQRAACCSRWGGLIIPGFGRVGQRHRREANRRPGGRWRAGKRSLYAQPLNFSSGLKIWS
jgi:hypothetical protein